MCMHVLCLSLKGPPPLLSSSFEAHKWGFCTFFCSSFSLTLSLSLYNFLGFLVLIYTFLDLLNYIISLQVLSPSLSLSLSYVSPFLYLKRRRISTRNIRMRAPSSSSSQLKQEFLKKWITGLQVCNSRKKEMNILERKKTIKLTADLAMAASSSTRNGSSTSTTWSRALIANASRDNTNIALINCITGSRSYTPFLLNKNGSSSSISMCKKKKKMLRRRRRWIKRCTPALTPPTARCIAKRMVKKRTKFLKSLVPGGELMDDYSLIQETLDYIISLRAQVDVMRSVLISSSCK